MKTSRFITYAALILLLGGGAIWYIISNAGGEIDPASADADVVMYRNEGCQCCEQWARYMESNGYSVATVNSDNLQGVKSKYDVPYTVSACHTAVIEGYVVEGHVPVEDVKRLLEEQPDAIGVGVPGMPASSPGMNTADNVPFESYLIHNDGSTEVFGRH